MQSGLAYIGDMKTNFEPKLVSQNQTKPARVVWGVQTSPEYVAWCVSKGYAESFLQKVIFGQSGKTAPGAAGAQMQGHARDMASQQTK